jgi:hypothetical protein
VIFAEYAIDTAVACHAQGVATVAVTAGYIHPEARRDFYAVMDAANVDLKAFTDDFYVHQCGAHLAPVLDTLAWLHHETDVWVEITTLLIPGLNDSDAELTALAKWVATEMGPDVPLHFTAFHPDYKLDQLPPTPPATLSRARRIARDAGLHYVYTGNVHDPEGGTTYCPGCGAAVIERDWYAILAYRLDARGACQACGHAIAGRYGEFHGAFGPRRVPVHAPNLGSAIVDGNPRQHPFDHDETAPQPLSIAAGPIWLEAMQAHSPDAPGLILVAQTQSATTATPARPTSCSACKRPATPPCSSTCSPATRRTATRTPATTRRCSARGSARCSSGCATSRPSPSCPSAWWPAAPAAPPPCARWQKSPRWSAPWSAAAAGRAWPASPRCAR